MGGMETNLVNLINRAPADRYRHAIITVTEADSFRAAIRVPGVEVVELGKRPGLDPGWLLRLYGALRRLRPALFHTRNLAALEGQFAAAAARVPGRIHSVEGRDTYDLDGTNKRYNRLRRAARPFIHGYIAVSRDLAGWLEQTIHVPPARVHQITNGVDTTRFEPRQGPRTLPAPDGRIAADSIVVGNVGRVCDVKDPLALVDAFARARMLLPADIAARLRLVWLGDGPLLADCHARLQSLGLSEAAWFPGSRHDVADLIPGFDLFAMSSLAEGIPIAVLEAMACGLSVICPRVGGLPELIDDGVNGSLVEPRSVESLAAALADYAAAPDVRLSRGAAARQRAETRYSLDAVIARYLDLYDTTLHQVHFGEAFPAVVTLIDIVPSRKILLVSYLFPPAGGIAVQRILSLARYLPELGYEVHVLTAGNPGVPTMDPTLLKLVPPEVRVHRTFTPEVPYAMRRRLWSVLSALSGGGKPKAAAAQESAPAPGQSAGQGGGLGAVARRIFNPDPEVVWTPFAIRAGRKILRRHSIDAMLVTTPPFSSFLVTNQLKREFPQVKLISDFRDEWLDFYLSTFAYFKSEGIQAKARRIERETAELSDAVVTVTHRILDRIRSRYPDQPDSRFHWIPNGFDPQTFAGFQPRTHGGDQVLVVLAGTVYNAATPRFHLDGLDRDCRPRCAPTSKPAWSAASHPTRRPALKPPEHDPPGWFCPAGRSAQAHGRGRLPDADHDRQRASARQSLRVPGHG